MFCVLCFVFCVYAYFTYRNEFLSLCDVYLNHHFTYTLLLRSHTYMTIVGLDFRPPLDAAERVPLYHWVSPLNHQLSHTRTDTAFPPGKYPRHGCSLWIYPPTHWVYTRITPFALFIYEDSSHINPGMGHGINTGTHMCIFVRIPVCALPPWLS